MSEDLQQLLKEGIETSIEYLPRLITGLEEIVNLFHEGQEKKATEMLIEASEGLEWFSTLLSSFRVIPVNFKIHSVTEKNFNDYIDDTLNIYTSSIKAIENGDYVLFTDLVTYEFIPAIKSWLEVSSEIVASLNTH